MTISLKPYTKIIMEWEDGKKERPIRWDEFDSKAKSYKELKTNLEEHGFFDTGNCVLTVYKFNKN